jgi:hypothetical protein
MQIADTNDTAAVLEAIEHTKVISETEIRDDSLSTLVSSHSGGRAPGMRRGLVLG